MDLLLIDPDCYRMCRLCMNSCENDFVSIYDVYDDNLVINMIVECAQLEIHQDDLLPKNACSKCADSINIAYHVIQKCRQSDATLRSLLKMEDGSEKTDVKTGSDSSIKIECLNTAEYEILFSDTMEYDHILKEAKEDGNCSIEPLSDMKDDLDDYNEEPQEMTLDDDFEDNSELCLDVVDEMRDAVIEEVVAEEEASLERVKLKKSRKHLRRKCCGCKRDFENETRLMEHSNKVHSADRDVRDTKRTFECSICYKRFVSDQLLKEHNRSIYRKYQCPQCGKKFMTRANLNNHMKHHSDKNMKKCCGCRKDFDNEIELMTHSKSVHEPYKTEDITRPHECDICFRRYPSRKSLVTHKRLVSRHQCEQCGQIFMKKLFLTMHQKTHQTEETKKKCCGCREEFDTDQELMEHSEKMHRSQQTNDGAKPFECDICFKRVSSKIYLQQHKKKVYSEKSFQCPTCGRAFTRAHDLANHENTHSDDMPYECSVCSRRFKNKTYLKNHFKLHTDISKNHICDECGKAFRTKDLLKTHAVGHSDVRKYQCYACPSSFKRLYCLKSHMRVHTGEKAFACHLCEKRYVQSTDLKRHLLTHSTVEDSKPYQCHYCLRRYPRKDYLKIHISKQHVNKQNIVVASNSNSLDDAEIYPMETI